MSVRADRAWALATGIALALLTTTIALGACDDVPDLRVEDPDGGTADPGMDAKPAPILEATTAEAATVETSAPPIEASTPPEAGCETVACPSCPPAAGACCPNGVPCVGEGCIFACAQCMCMPGQVCCLKSGGGPPMVSCRPGTDKCP